MTLRPLLLSTSEKSPLSLYHLFFCLPLEGGEVSLYHRRRGVYLYFSPLSLYHLFMSNSSPPSHSTTSSSVYLYFSPLSLYHLFSCLPLLLPPVTLPPLLSRLRGGRNRLYHQKKGCLPLLLPPLTLPPLLSNSSPPSHSTTSSSGVPLLLPPLRWYQ